MDDGESGQARSELRRNEGKINLNSNSNEMLQKEFINSEEDQNNQEDKESNKTRSVIENLQVDSDEDIQYMDYADERLETEGNIDPEEQEVGK